MRQVTLIGLVACIAFAGPARAWAADTPRSQACADAPLLPQAQSKFFVLAEGDSITFGQGSSDGRSYVQRTCVLSANGIETVDTAQSRAVLGAPPDAPQSNSLYGRLKHDNDILLAKRAGRIAILTVLIGRNDLVGFSGGPAGYADALARYVATMRKAGWDRVIVGTLLPSDWAPFVAPRTALNAILLQPGWARAHGIDVIADFAASPTMGPNGAAADKRLYVDGIHPTDYGYGLLAPIYGAALARAMQNTSLSAP